jgi:hypothetical protein
LSTPRPSWRSHCFAAGRRRHSFALVFLSFAFHPLEVGNLGLLAAWKIASGFTGERHAF